ncbi:MAG TPA: hypothetical protein VHH34_25310 [Pseudonocardiaceae bacterium]|nr:hypothetical protein [Pseudonocardiaceae bacterium]
MLQRHHCVSVACDQCGHRPGGPEFEQHWPTATAALEAVIALGWYVAEDGHRVWCPDCGPVLVCEAEGHELSQWQACLCCSAVQYRHCSRCGLHESRPTTPVELAQAVA